MSVTNALDIKKGDLVLTHSGNYKNIIKTIERDYNGKIIAIKPQGGLWMRITPDHPVLCFKNTSASTSKKRFSRYIKKTPEWIKACEISHGDLVCEAIDQDVNPVTTIDLVDFLKQERFTNTGKLNRAGLHLSKIIIDKEYIKFSNPRSHPIKRIIEIDADLCRLLGYYIAEGSCGHHNISFSFNSKESEYLEDVKRIIKEKFETETCNRTKDNCTTLSVSSHILRDFFQQFKNGASNKIIPEWIAHLPPELQVEFINGAWRGDGCINKNENFVYVSTSKNLVLSIRMMLYRLGIVPGITISRPNGKINHVISGKTVRFSKPLYCLSVTGGHAIQLAKLFNIKTLHKNKKQVHTTNKIINGFVTRFVVKTEKEDYSGKVYNFEVEDNHTYQTDSGLLHNCDVTSYAVRVMIESFAEDTSAPFIIGI